MRKLIAIALVLIVCALMLGVGGGVMMSNEQSESLEKDISFSVKDKGATASMFQCPDNDPNCLDQCPDNDPNCVPP